jgi:hypothetical protein
MKTGITFDNLTKYCNVGNEIFSNTFVLRHLEYSNCDYVFDNKYTLTVMDNNMNIYTLKYDNYLLVKENELSCL